MSSKVLQVCVALALPLALLIGNIQLLGHMRFVRYQYGKAGFPADTAFPPGGYALSRPERAALAEAAMQSIIGPEGMRALEEARFREMDAPAFIAREIRHMRDVRLLFQQARVVFWVALATLIGGTALLARHGARTGQGRRPATQPLLVSALATLALAAALGLYILLNFNNFFTRFHHVFFAGNTWLFRQDDTLIRLFPTQFWFDAATIIAGLTAIELILVGIVAWWWGKNGTNADPG